MANTNVKVFNMKTKKETVRIGKRIDHKRLNSRIKTGENITGVFYMEHNLPKVFGNTISFNVIGYNNCSGKREATIQAVEPEFFNVTEKVNINDFVNGKFEKVLGSILDKAEVERTKRIRENKEQQKQENMASEALPKLVKALEEARKETAKVKDEKEAEAKRADKEQARAERAEQDTRVAIQRAETAESRLQRAEKRFSHNTFKQYGELIRKGYTDEQAWEIINMFN